MALNLRDIIDLEFFFNLDEQHRESGEGDLSARDREIFREINAPDLSDKGLVREWLFYRRLLFFHETAQKGKLPGALFATLASAAARGLFVGGLILGLSAAYSFLAYHGDRPVNVTVFITLFILLQALVSCASFGLMARQAMAGNHPRPPLLHALMSGLFFKRLGRHRSLDLPGGPPFKPAHETGHLIKQIYRNHSDIMAWSFFILSSLFALGFSFGALGGTLFRVAVTDLAFGWQSTLLTSGSQVHELVRWIALPWSWAFPSALPGLVQIEGSRIILKEGIAHLSTAHLTAWWPFLTMGLLAYGVVLRLALVGIAFWGRSLALARFDTDQPRFRRLLVRMRTPNMDTRTRESGVTTARNRPAPPRPKTPEAGESPAREAASGAGINPASSAGALVLIPEPLSLDRSMATLTDRMKDQLGLEIRDSVVVSLDVEQDANLLSKRAAGHKNAPVIFIQEVWQPPIRGLLHYYSQVKEEIFSDRPVWILLIQTIGEADPGVPADDMNYKVWKEAVARLGHPSICLERIRP